MEKRFVTADVCLKIFVKLNYGFGFFIFLWGNMAELDDKELQRYENLLLKVQQYQIPEREVTFFDSAFRKHHENPTTELLAFFLNMNAPHSLHDTFYKGFIKSIQDSNTEYRNFEFGHMQDLGYEEITENFKRIDLWVETEKALIIVEVKIGHIQNNPVDDYKEWAEQQIEHKQKEIIKMVLNIDGQCHFPDWFGLPFQNLTNHIRPLLAQRAIQDGLSKWNVFARDFLLHLDNFYEQNEVNMDVIDFVVRNHTSIEELFKIREIAYEEIKKYILKSLRKEFDNQEFKAINELRNKKEYRGWRFSTDDSATNTEIGLFLNFQDNPIAEIWLFLDLENKDSSIKGKVDAKLKKSNHPSINKINWKLSNQDFNTESEYRNIGWDFNEFDIKEISEVIIYVQRIINEFD